MFRSRLTIVLYHNGDNIMARWETCRIRRSHWRHGRRQKSRETRKQRRTAKCQSFYHCLWHPLTRISIYLVVVRLINFPPRTNPFTVFIPLDYSLHVIVVYSSLASVSDSFCAPLSLPWDFALRLHGIAISDVFYGRTVGRDMSAYIDEPCILWSCIPLRSQLPVEWAFAPFHNHVAMRLNFFLNCRHLF